MAEVAIALGSNLGDRLKALSAAADFLEGISDQPIKKSRIYVTEPVGMADREFFNAAILIQTALKPSDLLESLKTFEMGYGRDPKAPRWSNRLIDMDIITWGNLEVDDGNLKIPHPEYTKRLFVLMPLKDILPDWTDPATGIPIDELISKVGKMAISKTGLKW